MAFKIEWLQKLVDNGPHPPPGETGAKFIIREDGRRINLTFMKAGADKRLEIGDKTRAEMRDIMSVPRNIVSGQANKPVIGIVQDSLLGCRLMTKRDTFIEKDLMMDILMCIDGWDGSVPMPAILKPRPMWTGKQVISMYLPDINIKRTSAWYKDSDPDSLSIDDSQVLIKKGELLTGTLCKKALGPGGGGLVHITWMELGPDATRLLINNTQVTITCWLMQHGMSIGIADTVADDGTMTTINDIIEKAKEEVKKLIGQYQAGELEAMPGRSMSEAFENRVNAVLNKARDDAGKRAQGSLTLENNIIKMSSAATAGLSEYELNRGE
eukprot:gene31185-6329_t